MGKVQEGAHVLERATGRSFLSLTDTTEDPLRGAEEQTGGASHPQPA